MYYRGESEPFELNWDRADGTHQIGFQDQRGKERNKPTLNKRDANATPLAFRDELVKLALHSGLSLWEKTYPNPAGREEMPDFQMCGLDDCPYSKQCKRHPDSGTKPSPLRQAWGPFIKYGPMDKPENCDGWWPIKEPKRAER